MNRQQFLKKVTRQPDGCWIWKGSRRGANYAQCSAKDEPSRIASHLAYRLFKGEVSSGLCVLHTCDNPPCVRPKHLFLGTHKENSQDMASKGRVTHPPGRPYNTNKARKKLAALYKNPTFRKSQGAKIREGWRKRNLMRKRAVGA